MAAMSDDEYGDALLERHAEEALLAEAVQLLKDFGNSCEDPIRHVGRDRLYHRTYKNGRGRWVLRGRVVPPGPRTALLFARIKETPCGRCWDCRRRAFLAKVKRG